MKRSTFRSRRRVAAWLQAALLLSLPFARIREESVLRFDLATLKLYFFGSVIWISEAYFYLLVFLLFFMGVMLFTVLYGRVWCGWICPQTVLSDFARRLDGVRRWFGRRSLLGFAASQVSLLFVSVLVAANLIWYFVSPYDMFAGIITLSLGPWTLWSWAVFSSLIYLNLAFVRQKFCGSVCPYARLQSAFFDDQTLTIAFDRSRAEECPDCRACVGACPAGIDIRDGLQVECVNCAECIDACVVGTEQRGKTPLIGYLRGTRGLAPSGPRARVVGLSVAFAFFGVLLAHQIAVRIPMDLWVFREEAEAASQTDAHGRIQNSYTLIVENRSLRTATMRLSISGIKDAELAISRNPFSVPPNLALTMKVYVFARRENVAVRTTQLRFTMENNVSREIRIIQETFFVYPERTSEGVEI